MFPFMPFFLLLFSTFKDTECNATSFCVEKLVTCDIMHVFRGRKKISLLFCILHLFVAILKTIFSHPSIWLASVCLSLATSIFLFSFETWMVVEHDKVCMPFPISIFIFLVSSEQFFISCFFFIAARAQARFIEWNVLAYDISWVCIFNWKPSLCKLVYQQWFWEEHAFTFHFYCFTITH